MGDKNRKSGVREQIDENLRRVYQEALHDELPPALTALLDKLRAQEAGDCADKAENPRDGGRPDEADRGRSRERGPSEDRE